MLRMVRMLRMLGLGVVAFAVFGSGPSRYAGAQSDTNPCTVERMLVFSIPDLSWRALRDADVPNIEEFLAGSAVASLAPARTVPHDAGPADAYLTFGAGARTIGHPPVDGEVMHADEQIDGVPVSELASRRFDAVVEAPIIALGWPRILRENDDLPYESRAGELAAELADNDIDTAVIANADGSDTAAKAFHREAALALSAPDGTLSAGAVATNLLLDDPTAPFGVRLNDAAVVDAFDAVWSTSRAVVLVEASDIPRAIRYGSVSTSEQRRVATVEALASSDRLFAALLDRVDLDRDAVLVIAPPDGMGRRDLNVLGLKAPCDSPGWLRSASTQKEGVVSMIDIAPGILAQFDIEYTEKMEGRPFEVHASAADLDARMERMIDHARGSEFRAEQLFPATVVFIVALSIVALGAVLLLLDPAIHRRASGIVSWFACVAMAAYPATLWVRLLPGHETGPAAYYGWLTLVALVVGSVVVAVARTAIARVATLLGVALGTILLDAMTGSQLHYNAVFGYSPTSNSRLYGISNYSFGVVVVTSLCIAAGLAHFLPRRGAAAALGLLGFVLVVEGMPVWGSDVGGVLAAVPTFLVFALLVSRRRVRLRTVAVAMTATAAAIALFAAVDLARPAEERAHLGRLVERVQRDGVGPLFAIVGRKLEAAMRESTKSFWVTAIPIVIVIVLVVGRAGRRPLARICEQIPTLRAALLAAIVGVVLGSALNDSGAIVGGTLSYMLSLSLIIVCLAANEIDAGPIEPEAVVRRASQV